MEKKYPFYLKTTVILFGLVLFVFILFTLREIMVPLAFSLLLAVLLNPLVNKLQQWRIRKMWAIVISIILAFLVIMFVGYFLTTQIAGFSDQLPLLKKKFAEMVQKVQQGISDHFGINMQKQQQYLNEAEAGIKPILGSTLGSLMSTFAMVFLLPVYTFLFLFYKTLIIQFLYDIFSDDKQELNTVLKQTKGAIQNYMFGLLLEALIVATLNTVALLLLGVQYAILLGVIGAILNVLPYIGGIIAVALPVVIATVTKEGYQTQLGIVVAYIVIQFVDNHFLIPYIVSSKVKINALVSIIIVLLGGALWGISGMFLSIPFIGVLKLIFDRIPELKPWGKLLGDEVPTKTKGKFIGLKHKPISKTE